jgi:hypothetical protein
MSLVATLQRHAETARAHVRKANYLAARTWRRAVQQERMLATTTFALIFATMLSCVDFLVTGAPDWNPGGEAYAMEPAHRARMNAAELTAPDEAPALVTASAIERGDYRFTNEVLLGGPDAVLPVEAKFSAMEAATALASEHTKAL